MVQPGDEFYLVDQGDGWWDCPSPLRCVVLDGPGPLPLIPGSGVTGSLLVRTEPAVEWNGDPSYEARWGPDHPLCHAIEPTHKLVLLAGTDSFSLNLAADWSVPATPVNDDAERLDQVQVAGGLGMKVAVSSTPSLPT